MTDTPDLSNLFTTPDLSDLGTGLDLNLDLSGFDLTEPDPTPDPLAAVDYTGNVEEDSHRELSAMEQAYRDRAQKERDRNREALDSEYWFCVVFRTREDKNAFLERYRLREVGDKYLLGKDLDHAFERAAELQKAAREAQKQAKAAKKAAKRAKKDARERA